MEAILIGVACVAMLAGAIFYNPLRRKMAGVIGVGGSYVVLIGVMLLIMGIGQMISGGGSEAATSEIVMTIVFMVVCLGYMVYVMIARCHTMKQRILLPFAACLIGMGFCWRFLMALFLHIPMESGKSVEYPKYLYSPEGKEYKLLDQDSIKVTYIADNGDQKVFIKQDGIDAGWTTEKYS